MTTCANCDRCRATDAEWRDVERPDLCFGDPECRLNAVNWRERALALSAALDEARRERDEARADLESVWHVAGEKLGDDRGMDAYTPADAMTNILDSLIAERDDACAERDALREAARALLDVGTVATMCGAPEATTARLRLRALLEAAR